jgi:hypothetical protein
MKRTISGIPFIIHSPSLYQIDAYDDGSDIHEAALAFDGKWWRLHVQLKRGHIVTRDFATFAAAMTLLSSRRAA